MAVEGESLESLLNRATSPANRDEDWEYIMAFCDQVNKELEGPQIAVRLLAHKIQSPQEREAVYGISTLEACVKNCGRRFHQEIGKFRFLNELIKVISPKYLGTRTSEKVKKRCIELLYSWTFGLKHELKIAEAYSMLKTQGIVKEDPTYVNKTMEPPPPPRPKNTLFEDEEKSKMLSRLLKSKNPEDLQAANRLIKNMVKQDADRMEKVSKRMSELETINNNIKVLSEMLAHYKSDYASQADKEMMKELYDMLEKLRPNLFRLASDTDEKDNDGINDILKANDSVMRIMTEYKKKVEGVNEENDSASNHTSLLDFGFDQSSPTKTSQQTNNISMGTSILDEQLLALGLCDLPSDGPATNDDNTLNELNDIFAASAPSTATVNTFTTPNILTCQQPVFPVSAFHSLPQSALKTAASASSPMYSVGNISSPQVFTSASSRPAVPVSSSVSQSHTVTSAQKKAMDELDLLGQTMMQQSLAKDKQSVQVQSQPSKVPLNQVIGAGDLSIPLSLTEAPQMGSSAPIIDTSETNSLGSMSPSISKVGSPEVLSLADLHVPLETIQPGSLLPLTAYDKNGLKIVFHFGLDQPRPDVSVIVVSIMSTNSNPVKNFLFQAAVPKLMKVKLQPSSATDLPAYNPILPPAAITQVMLLANPQKEKIRLKFKITYSMDGQIHTDVGDVDGFPGE